MAFFRLSGKAPLVGKDCWVADSAQVMGGVTLADQVSIWFGAVVRADNEPMYIGCGSNVQDCAVLHSDPGAPLTIGCDVTIGHQAVVHGCTVGDGSLIGIGAVVLNRARIGRDSLVAAGAVVTEGKEFPDGSLIVGSPATVKRALTEAQILQLRESAAHYRDNARRFSLALERLEIL